MKIKGSIIILFIVVAIVIYNAAYDHFFMQLKSKC